MRERLQELAASDGALPFLIWRDQPYSYAWLAERVGHWRGELEARGITDGAVVTLEADYSPNAVALLLALVELRCIAVPLLRGAQQIPQFREIAEAGWCLTVDAADEVSIDAGPAQVSHPMLRQLRDQGHPGLVLFSSGSSGKPKAIVHDLSVLMERYRRARKPMRTVAFLIFDHIGGINTLFFTLFSGGTVVALPDRGVDTVLRAIERHRVELLPTSPTFLKLVLLNEGLERFDLSSLRRITYGTEPMPEAVLTRLREVFPEASCQQTYGLSEIGILSSRSKGDGSLWVQVGGEGYQTRIVDGILQIKARTTMLGYLNAPSPFTEDGWLDTQDAVEVDGDYIRILGRKSEIINVGGEKVYPAEVESVIMELPDVLDVTVHGRAAITGSVVCATVRPRGEIDPKALKRAVQSHCASRLPRYKVPVTITVESEAQHGERFKKVRVKS